ncbi:uracil phosphoribosyltransferase [Belliella sp. DSM 111904]|uniref:Uracil phosphoribosyltransferase n=1 Tax=Belliella filtrata TaxID=2923435 RepID=A0ABS9UXX5_9BACT|nr:uracil phosphoribosyltransferase [Belliella filtrata]MCH7408795.1 uracil phosphoribosyltransferase [Belliella filtrata]
MFILNQQNSIANTYLAEIRDTKIQTDRLRFRKNLERLGEILAYELSKSLQFGTKEITTPLETTGINMVKSQPVLICVLRAANPFYQGFLNIFDHSDSGFIGAFRTEEINDNQEISIELSYQAAPDISGKHVIIIDPMLATGKSFVKTVKSLLNNGKPEKIHVASVIAAPEGVAYINEQLGTDLNLWTCALDSKLNEKSYIVPGLGDAGDLAFGPKI